MAEREIIEDEMLNCANLLKEQALHFQKKFKSDLKGHHHKR
jgi:hypothetical protein